MLIIKMIWLTLWRITQFVFLVLPLVLVGIVILAVYLPFMPKWRIGLPTPIKWFDNWGSDLYGNQLGRKDTLWNRYTWLAWRNPVNWYQYSALGLNREEGAFKRILGDILVGDLSKPGWCYIEYGKMKSLYIVVKYTQKLCFRLRVGHKDSLERGKRQWVCSISPIMRYRGI